MRQLQGNTEWQYMLHLMNYTMKSWCPQTWDERTDSPVVAVNFLRILTTIQPLPNVEISDLPSSKLRAPSASGQNTTLSPVFKRDILSNKSSLVDSSSNATRRFRCFHHNGELNRWQITVEHRPIMSSGMTIGSCVEIIVRIPRCLCCLITLNIESTNGVEVLFVRYWRLEQINARNSPCVLRLRQVIYRKGYLFPNINSARCQTMRSRQRY